MTDTLAAPGPTAETPPTAPRRPRARPAWPAIVSFALGFATVGALITGIVLATSDRFEQATWAAYGAAGISVAGVLFGVLALVVGRSRGWAVAGMLLALVANPLLLTPALAAIGGLWS
jgi:uncharacterized membrane protein